MSLVQEKLTTNGIKVGPEFPTTEYLAIHDRVVSTSQNHDLYKHFAGAWNALSYRYKAMTEHGDDFVASLKKHGSSPPPEERYGQEKLLFDFFSASFSCFESTFYAFYTVGAFINTKDFNLTTERDQQKVSPNSTKEAFVKAFPSEQFVADVLALFKDVEYQKIRETRNILTHRTAPGRTMYVSLGVDDAPATEWKLNNSPMDESIVLHTKGELSRMLSEVLSSFLNFTNSHLVHNK